MTSKTVKQAIKNEVQSIIYSRGVDYFRGGQVREWSVKEDKADGTLIVSGRVEGSEDYKVVLEFDPQNEEFFGMECTCPYGDICKHAVALALAFANSLEHDNKSEVIDAEVISASDRQIDETRLRKMLNDLGLSAKNIPADVITLLLKYQENKTKKTKQDSLKDKPFKPEDYYIALSTYNGYVPTFHEKKNSYQQTDIRKILARVDLTAAQRELLVYIKDGKFGQYQSRPPDPAKLFPLLVQSGFTVCKNNYSYGYSDRNRLTVDIHPQPLRAEIVYEPVPMHVDKTKVRHDFFLRIPATYGNGRNPWYDELFSIQGSGLVRDQGSTVELHQLTPLLTGIIARIKPVFDHARNVISYQTRVTGEELEKIDQLIRDASALLTLTTTPPQLIPQAVKIEPEAILAVDFDNDAQTLRVMPTIDYGIYKQDISESVYLSRRANSSALCRRPPFEHPGNHIITVANGVIRYAKTDEKKEIGFYRELAKRADDFGFTKTLKCQRRGATRLKEYLLHFWPVLSAYTKEKGYPIVFTKDELPLEQAAFRADFTADINTGNDWLYFDFACYCGDERVTLEKLLAFMESGLSFWRKDDGTLVEISNRQELERLVRMLKSFHARENGGFEGRLHHAPELEYVMTSSPHYNSVRAKSFKQFINRVQDGKPVKKVRLPNTLAKILRPYQKAGIEWLYFLRSYRFAGILADDMGLGKTLQTLTILNLEKVTSRPSLVVCPKTLLYNWKLEAEKFFPGLKIMVYDGNPRERLAKRKKIRQQDVAIVSYGTLKRDEAALAQYRFNYAVLDEAQFIKNHATKSAQIVKKLNADYRLALTGTPLENSVSELWSIYDFLMPGFLGTYEHFAKQFHKPIMDTGDRQVLEHLRRKVKGFMLRRIKADVLKELPPKIEQLSQCHLSEAQNILYQQILVNVRGEVFSAVKEKGFKSAQIHIFAALTKLRQACNHPALLIKDKDFREYKSAKLEMCMELVDEVVKSDRKVLIFSQFTKMLDIVSASLHDQNIPHVYLSGKTNNRQSLIDRFNTDPSIPVFLISLKAGGTGLNLTAADTVIIFDPWWNPSVENQAIDRTHRIGQTRTVNVYRLLTSGTIEEKIQALKQRKQLLFDALVGESGNMFQKMTWDDVRELFAD